MRFLSPLALVGLALIALPVAIHFLVRRRASRLNFPSLIFLRETPSFRLRPRRIQQPLLLALRIAALVLLILGLSRPLITLGTRTQRQRIILLDASLSMEVRGRTEAARERVRGLINGLADGETAAIVTFSTASSALSPMTTAKRELYEAIDHYQPTGATADYAEGFRAANELLQTQPPGDVAIDIVSDFQESGLRGKRLEDLESGLIGHARITRYPVGVQLDRNAVIIDEKVSAGDSGHEISSSELTLTPDETSGVRKTSMLDSPEGEHPGLVWRTETNGQITARISTAVPDDFDADDERFLAFTPPRKGRALLIDREGDDAAPYLRAALEATATDLGEKYFSVEVKPTVPNSSSDLASYSLVTMALHGSLHTDELHALADYARAGGIVWLCIGNDLDTSQWNQFANTDDGRAFPITNLVRKTDADQFSGFGSVEHEATALSLLNNQVISALLTVRMRGNFAITPRADSTMLMRWNDGTPAFVQMDVGSGSVLLLATSPSRASGDLGASAAFPALASSIARMGMSRVPLAREIGQPVKLELAPQTAVKIIDARGKSQPANASDLLTHPLSYFPNAGIYKVESQNLSTYLAFNSPKSESELPLATAMEVDKFFTSNNTATVEAPRAWYDGAEKYRNTWRYFLFGAFGLLIAELLITMKRNEDAGVKAD